MAASAIAFDLAGFAVGAMERGRSLPDRVSEGDILLGLASDGVHSNGYSLVRKIVEQSGMGWEADSPFSNGTLGRALLAPTRIYVKSAIAAIRNGGVNALVHVTGGGLTENLPRALPDGLGVTVDLNSWQLPSVFKWLSDQGSMEQAEVLKTFNSGLGMIAIVTADRADEITELLHAHGETVYRIGHVNKGKGVTYQGQLL